MANNKLIPIPGRLHDVSTDGIVSGADEIFDDAKGKRQSVINQETDAALDNKYDKDETYSKQELNNLITTPNQDYVTVPTYASLPATGEADTVYRVSNYDGEQSQVDATKYSEYAWDGTQYVFLCVKTQIGEVFDITAYNSNTKYADLADALSGTNVPDGVRKGGMSVKFVQSSDNKYIQWRLMASQWSTTESDWQGVDSKPIDGSKNLVESGGVYNDINAIKHDVDGDFTKDIVWTDGYINTKGLISSSSQSKFSQPFVLKKGERVTVGTNNSNITIIGSTESSSLAVGDTVTVIQKTSSTSQFETYSYTADEDIKIVVCVRFSDYTLSFHNTHCYVDVIDNVDDVPTPGSPNLVKSSGVNSRIDGLAHSLMQNYPLDNYETYYGWVNPDGSITDRGTYRTYTIPLNGLYQFISFKGRLGNSALTISFYDTNGNIISNASVFGADSNNLRTYTSEIPSNALMAKCCTFNTDGVQIFLQKSSIVDDEEKLNVNIKCKSAASYYGNDDFDNRIFGKMNAATKKITATSSASLLYYNADGISSVEVIQRVSAYYSSYVNCVAIAFQDATGVFIGDVIKMDFIGLHSYYASVPNGAKTIIVGIGNNQVPYNVFLYKNQGIKDIENIINLSINKDVVTRDISGYDYFLRGYIPHNGDGSITPSASTRTFKFKNWGYKYVKVNAFYTSGEGGELALFNAISFYSADEWLGGQGYMKEQSIQPRYSQRRKEYLAEIPDGCGIICITLGISTLADSLVTFYNGKGKDYLPILKYDTDVHFNLPSYYTKRYLDGKVNLIRKRIKLNASNSDCFFFMTDEHAERNNMWSMGLIKYLNDKLHIKKLFSGGDFSHEGVNEYGIEMRRKAFDGEIYQAIGNHEYLNYSWANHQADSSVPFVATTEDDVYYGFSEFYGNNVKFGNKQRHYFYFDNEIQQIRYVFLSSFRQGDGIINSAQAGYEQEQLDWFENVALDVEIGWSIVIITHRLYEHQASNNTVYISANCVPVKDIIEQYDGNGKIIAVFQGHTHRDRIQYLKDGAIPVIITTSDQNGSYVWSSDEGKYVRGGDVERESGTINEQAFDVVTIDKTLKRISCVRIGCPARNGTEPGGELVEERVVYWQ